MYVTSRLVYMPMQKLPWDCWYLVMGKARVSRALFVSMGFFVGWAYGAGVGVRSVIGVVNTPKTRKFPTPSVTLITSPVTRSKSYTL